MELGKFPVFQTHTSLSCLVFKVGKGTEVWEGSKMKKPLKSGAWSDFKSEIPGSVCLVSEPYPVLYGRGPLSGLWA